MKYIKYVLLAFVAIGIGVGLFYLVSSRVEAAPFTLMGSSDLTLGSRGQNVVQLQGLLSEFGYLDVPIGVPYGYFGPLTQSALAKYQSSSGISPARGYFGPITRGYMQNYLSGKGWLSMLMAYTH